MIDCELHISGITVSKRIRRTQEPVTKFNPLRLLDGNGNEITAEEFHAKNARLYERDNIRIDENKKKGRLICLMQITA